jgi:hypothetical protein
MKLAIFPAAIGMCALASVAFADPQEWTASDGPVALTDAEMDMVTAAGNHENRSPLQDAKVVQDGLVNVAVQNVNIQVAAQVLAPDSVIEFQ